MTTTEQVPQTPAPASPWTLGDRMGKARRMAGLTILELNAKTGVARNAIANYEKDEKHPPRHVVMAVAMATCHAFPSQSSLAVYEWLDKGDFLAEMEAFTPSDLRGNASARSGRLPKIVQLYNLDRSA